MAYTTITNVQEFFGTTFDGTTSPTLTQVTAYLADVDTEINNLTGTVFGTPVSNTEIIDIDGYTDIFLTEKYPIVSVTSVSKNTATDAFETPVWEVIDSYNDKVRICTKYKHNGKQKLKLVYTYGFDSIPPEVEHLATLLVVNKILSGQASGDSATQSISVGPISLSNSVGLSRMVNLKTEIKEYARKVGRYKNFTR